jgi:RimJ/RimL family protein N-acetyltransferase
MANIPLFLSAALFMLIMLPDAGNRIPMARPIKTRRLALREIADSDVPDIARLAGDWDVARMTARIPFPYSEALAREWMNTIGNGEFVRMVAHEGQLVGAVGYVGNDDGSAEIGYWIGKPWWGMGFATEAASALVRHCFTVAGFRRLTCCHFVDNPASQRVIEKLGFRPRDMTTAWCDARQAEIATQSYELLAQATKGGLLATFRVPFGRRRRA